MNYIDEARKYPLIIEPLTAEDGGGYVACSTAFPGMTGDGPSRDAAAEDLIAVLADVIEHLSKAGKELPSLSIANAVDSEFSGKLSLRLARSLHRKLAHQACTEGVSINTLIGTYIAIGLGAASEKDRPSDKSLDAVEYWLERLVKLNESHLDDDEYRAKEWSKWPREPKNRPYLGFLDLPKSLMN